MNMPWFKFFPGDYLRDTQKLSLEEHGAYQLLLLEYYSTGQPLPTDTREIARILRISSRKTSNIMTKLKPFFFVENGLYKHKRVEEELAKANEKSRKARDSANKRHHANAHANAHAPAMPPEPDTRYNAVERENVSTRLVDLIPTDWQPTPEILERCKIAGCPTVTQDHIQAFIAHYRGKDKPIANPDEKFLQWMIRQKLFDAQDRNTKKHYTPSNYEDLQKDHPAMLGESWDEYNARIHNLAERKRA